MVNVLDEEDDDDQCIRRHSIRVPGIRLTTIASIMDETADRSEGHQQISIRDRTPRDKDLIFAINQVILNSPHICTRSTSEDDLYVVEAEEVH